MRRPASANSFSKIGITAISTYLLTTLVAFGQCGGDNCSLTWPGWKLSTSTLNQCPDPDDSDNPLDSEKPDYVDLATGEFRTNERDFASLGIRHLDLTISRSYASGQQFDGPFGNNWDSPIAIKIADTGQGTPAVLRPGTARQDQFAFSTYNSVTQTTTYTSPPAQFATLTKTGLGTSAIFVLEAANGVKTTFVWMFSKGGLNWYHPSTVTDPCGNTITYGFCPHGRLLSIVDSKAASWSLTHVQTGPNQGRIASITAPWGATTSYTYANAGDLTGVRVPATDQFPLGSTYAYGYVTQGQLNSIQEPGKSQPYLFLTYDLSHRVGLQRYGSSSQLISIDYSTSPVVRVTDRNGVEIRHTVNTTTHQITSRSIIGTGSPPTSYTTTYSYNSDYLMTSLQTPLGKREEWTYDASSDVKRHGNLLVHRSRSSISDPTGLVTNYTYTTAYNLVSKVVSPNVTSNTSIANDPAYSLRMTYSAFGNMTRVDFPRTTDANGVTHDAFGTWTYDSKGRLAGRVDPLGITTTYLYAANDAFPYDECRDSTGTALHISRSYDARGDVVQVTSQCTCAGGADNRSYVYDARGQLREADSVVSSQQVRTTKYTYSESGEVAEIADLDDSPVGNGWARTDFSYDLLHHLTSKTTDVDSGTFLLETYSYDLGERLAETDLPNSSAIRYSYDVRGLPTEQRYVGDPSTSTDDLVWQLAYDNDGFMTSFSNPRGYSIGRAPDGYGRLVSVTDAAGFQNALTLDPDGNCVQISLKNSSGTVIDLSTMTYDFLDRQIRSDSWAKRTDGSNVGDGWRTELHFFDAVNRLTQLTNDAGGSWTYSYDSMGHLTTIRDSLAPASGADISYFSNGLVQQVSLLEGNQLTGASQSRVIESILSYDGAGDPLEVHDGLGNATHLEWNPRGRLSAVTDARGYRTKAGRDELGRVTDLRHFANVGTTQATDDVVFHATYDALSNVAQISCENSPYGSTQTTSFTYDAFGRRNSRTSSDGSVTTFDRTKMGRVSHVGDPTGTTKDMTYGPRDELTDVAIQHGTGVGGETWRHYVRDQYLRATSIENDGFLVLRSFGTLGLLERDQIQAKDGSGFVATTNADYDSACNLGSITYPSNSISTPRSIAWTRDAMGRAASATLVDGAGTGQYALKYTGSNLSQIVGPKTTTDLNRDGNGSLSRIAHTLQGTLRTETLYGRDSIDNISQVTRRLFRPDGSLLPYDDQGGCIHRVFDGFSRLTHTDVGLSESDLASGNYAAALRNLNYSYDRVSNRTSVIETILGSGSTTTSYAANMLNAYTTVASTTYGYDSNGNLSSGGSTSFAYDANNAVNSMTDASGTLAAGYDGLGRRITTTRGSSKERISYWGPTRTERVLFNGSVETDRQSFFPKLDVDDTLAYFDTASGRREDVLSDASGSPLAMADDTGAVAEAYRYADFGIRHRVDLSTGATLGGAGTALANPIGFTGQLTLYDSDSYMDFRARAYSPAWGRFIQKDPLDFADGIGNVYQFGGNNPGALDPFGTTTRVAEPTTHKALAMDSLGATNSDNTFSPDDMNKIANADMNTDYVPESEGGTGDKSLDAITSFGEEWNWLHPFDSISNWVNIQQWYHALGTDKFRKLQLKAWTDLVSSECNLTSLGHALQFAQDYWFHTDINGGPYWVPGLGHAIDSSLSYVGLTRDPDSPNSPDFKDKYEKAKQESITMINSFKDHCGPDAMGQTPSTYKHGKPDTPATIGSDYYPVMKCCSMDSRGSGSGVSLSGIGRQITFIPCAVPMDDVYVEVLTPSPFAARDNPSRGPEFVLRYWNGFGMDASPNSAKAANE